MEEVPFTSGEAFRYQRLEKKKQSKTFEIAFCGHFSAGKSTLLNKLLGAEILPTSPIPTSANIIRIHQGELSLTVHSHEEQEKRTFAGEIPWDQVRQWGMDGKSLSGMTITAPLPFLGEHGCIVDTPGVDSTDDSHEAVTVEQLYSTDTIVYVMDYNHVQSETNLSFLNKLSVEKKPIYIVINQIDKHDESEISLDVFKSSVESVFQEWDIQFIELFFTSMKKMQHPANEFKVFEKKIKALLFNSGRLIDDSFKQLTQGFYQAIKGRLLVEKQDSLNEIYESIEKDGYDPKDIGRQETLNAKLDDVRNYEEQMRESYQKELNRLYKNVTLFPYTTTELANRWMETMQPGYKTGLLFSKKKTEEEKQRRLTKLIEELDDKVKSQLIYHVQAYFQKVDREELLNKQAFEDTYENIRFELTPVWLEKQVSKGPKSSDYVYTFTKEITNKIVRDVQTKAAAVLEIWIKEKKQTMQEQEEVIVGKLLSLENLSHYKQQITDTNLSYSKQLENIHSMQPENSTGDSFEEQLVDTTLLSYPIETAEKFHNISLPTDSVLDMEEEEETFSENHFSDENVNVWLDNLYQSLNKRKASKILASERQQLLDRIERYQNQTFIISLFGAFSAGKSSFANALLGERVMPVSPNPTTATVTTVLPSDEKFPHGTAVLTLKSKKSLSEEINSVSSTLDLSLTIDSLKSWKPEKKTFVTSWQKTNADYLLTIQSSLKETTFQLGHKKAISSEELDFYIADEKHACLIEQVHIYYDCDLTKQGVVLVDTPGVNSIHARHTNVAFKQLRQSDAIFYLTYYNHAFSKADNYFLQQMGTVNRSFNHDKLYFIINASDLASSSGELNGVKHHVRQQLKNNGIENPRLYHLSSKEGLLHKEQKQQEETSFALFERAFYERTIIELKVLAVKILEHQSSQYMEKLRDSISFMTDERDIQVKKQKELKTIAASEVEKVNNENLTVVLRDVLHELDQFMLYLRQRITFVLNDYYPITINVSTLTGASKKELHKQLTGAIQEWRGYGEQFIRQELEAITIRLENVIKRFVEKWLTDQCANITKQLPYFSMNNDIGKMELHQKESDIHFHVDPQPYLSYLKSKRDFFENGKAKVLKEDLVKDGTEIAKEKISTSESTFKESVEKAMETLEAELKVDLTNAIQHESERLDALLDRKEKAGIEEELNMLEKMSLNKED